MKSLKFWVGVVVGLAIAGVIVAVVLHKGPTNPQDQLPPGVAPHNPTPKENAAARAALIQNIKTSHDLNWLKFGCGQYAQENEEMAYYAKLHSLPFDPPPTCRVLNPLVPTDPWGRW